MDPEIKELLKEDVALAKETNESLKELIRYQRLARWLTAIKWIAVIATTLGALYYVEPLVTSLMGTYSDLLNTVSSTSINTLSGQ